MTSAGVGATGPGPPPPVDPDLDIAFNSARGRWVLAATVLGTGIAFLDSTVVGIALPSISRAFGGGVGTLQWVVTGYSLTLAAFLLLGGALGDRFGRRRVFSIGVAWFALIFVEQVNTSSGIGALILNAENISLQVNVIGEGDR